MYINDNATFQQTAKFWTESYAKNPSASKDDAIARVCDMGFDKESARRALEKHNWNKIKAVNALRYVTTFRSWYPYF